MVKIIRIDAETNFNILYDFEAPKLENFPKIGIFE